MAWILLDVHPDGRVVLEIVEQVPFLAPADVTVGPLQAGKRYYLTGPLAGDLPGLGFGTIMFEGDQVGRKDIFGFARHVEATVRRYRKALQHGARTIIGWRSEVGRVDQLLEQIENIATGAQRPAEKVPRIVALLRRWRDGK